MKLIKRFIINVFQSIGYEIHKINQLSSPKVQTATILRNAKIDLVLDVGANEGQFSQEIRKAGYAGHIVSFEPLQQARARLERNQRNDTFWHLHPRCALGAYDGEIEINIAGNSLSSSVLPMLTAHQAAAPESAYQGKELTPLFKLDSIAAPYLANANNVFMKIDTQGYESQVLDGATDTLQRLTGIMIELSLIPLYEGQKLWLDMVDRLHKSGFVLWAVQPVFIEPDTGRTLQIDGIFLRQGFELNPEINEH